MVAFQCFFFIFLFAFGAGGAQGIGRAFAHALGEAGAKVAVVDINGEKAEEVAEELKARGNDSMAIAADVTKKADVERMVDTVVSKWKKLTIAVNNAGIGKDDDVDLVHNYLQIESGSASVLDIDALRAREVHVTYYPQEEEPECTTCG